MAKADVKPVRETVRLQVIVRAGARRSYPSAVIVTMQDYPPRLSMSLDPVFGAREEQVELGEQAIDQLARAMNKVFDYQI